MSHVGTLDASAKDLIRKWHSHPLLDVFLLMLAAGYILAVVGCFTCLVGEILMLKVAYKRGLGWFLCCLLLAPLSWVALLALHFKSAAMPFALLILGVILASIGGKMFGLDFG